MKSNAQLLNSMVRTARMGQTGLRAVLRCHTEPELEKALTEQLKAYDTLEDQAQALAQSRGWKFSQPDRALQHMIMTMTRMKVPRKNRTSAIADMVIQGNTQGMIKTLQDVHRYSGSDPQVIRLSKALASCETQNICQMKPFL